MLEWPPYHPHLPPPICSSVSVAQVAMHTVRSTERPRRCRRHRRGGYILNASRAHAACGFIVDMQSSRSSFESSGPSPFPPFIMRARLWSVCESLGMRRSLSAAQQYCLLQNTAPYAGRVSANTWTRFMHRYHPVPNSLRNWRVRSYACLYVSVVPAASYVQYSPGRRSYCWREWR